MELMLYLFHAQHYQHYPLIEKLEKKLNKIVLSSNQTLIWDSLNLIGNKKPV